MPVKMMLTRVYGCDDGGLNEDGGCGVVGGGVKRRRRREEMVMVGYRRCDGDMSADFGGKLHRDEVIGMVVVVWLCRDEEFNLG